MNVPSPECTTCFSAELAPYELADRLAVDGLAGKFRHRGFHHLAHVFCGRGTRVGDGKGDSLLERGRIDGRGEIRLEHDNLRGFLVDEILTAALRELLDRIAPLLDEGVDDLAFLGFVERA